MELNFFKYYHPRVLIVLIAICSISLFLAYKHWIIPISIISIISLILIFINKYLWSFKPFKWFFWVDDFRGTYKGLLNYNFIDNNELRQGSLEHVKTIFQTGSLIQIRSFTYDINGDPSSQSVSKQVNVTKDADGTYLITYTYENKGNTHKGFSPHYGTEVIKIIKDNEIKLSGDYYTNRQPQTRGTFTDMKHISTQINQPF